MTKTEFPTWKKENNKKSSSAIEALSDEDRVLDYGGLGNFSLSGFEMVSVATNEDEDDRLRWGWGFIGKDKGYQLLTIGAHSLRLHLYNHLLLTFRWLIPFYPRHLQKNSARKKSGPPPHTHTNTHQTLNASSGWKTQRSFRNELWQRWTFEKTLCIVTFQGS